MEADRIVMRFNPLPTLLKFDRQLPVYNWLYPFESEEGKVEDPLSVFTNIDASSGLRALYFHVPFCDTICSFCPFMRGEFESGDELDHFVQALLREIEIKHQYSAINSVPVDCIYFGGGTPSVLRVEHFYKLGEALHRYFDLSRLKEFTIECEVKSVTPEKFKAFQDIGVNRISFGVQTFNALYRDLFTMTATVDQIRQVSAWANEHFPFTNVDMIYGIPGQTLDEFLEDVDNVNSLGMTTVDYYTLNNVVAQPRMHRAFEEHGLKPLSANTKLSYRMFLNEYLRAQGYVPNSSYSFTRNTAPAGSPRVVVQDSRNFLYHKIIYGFADSYVDGYGAGAYSAFGPYIIYNFSNREQYATHVLSEKREPWFKAYGGRKVADKGIIHFPYLGKLEKSRVDWNAVHPETRTTFEESLAAGLAIDCGDRYELTEAGWLFAVNYMYALMPHSDQEFLSKLIARSAHQGRKADTITFFPSNRTVASTVPAR